jgi:hypothetical protein
MPSHCRLSREEDGLQAAVLVAEAVGVPWHELQRYSGMEMLDRLLPDTDTLRKKQLLDAQG